MATNKARTGQAVSSREGYMTAKRAKAPKTNKAKITSRDAKFKEVQPSTKPGADLQKNPFPKNTVTANNPSRHRV